MRTECLDPAVGCEVVCDCMTCDRVNDGLELTPYRRIGIDPAGFG